MPTLPSPPISSVSLLPVHVDFPRSQVPDGKISFLERQLRGVAERRRRRHGECDGRLDQFIPYGVGAGDSVVCERVQLVSGRKEMLGAGEEKMPKVGTRIKFISGKIDLVDLVV